MNVLILGSTGAAGDAITRYFSSQKNIRVDTLSRRDESTYSVDVTDIQSLAITLAKIKSRSYDIIINCIGMLVEDSEKYPELAQYVNARFPKMLEEFFSSTKTKIIHLSTDCVFSGKAGPYSERCELDASYHYGKTKSQGEINNTKDLTLRVSFIGENSSLIKYACTNNTLKGWINAYWSGFTSLQLAKILYENLEVSVTGIYHLVDNNLSASKYEVLEHIVAAYDLKRKIIPVTLERDLNCILVDTRRELRIEAAPYHEQFAQMRDFFAK